MKSTKGMMAPFYPIETPESPVKCSFVEFFYSLNAAIKGERKRVQPTFFVGVFSLPCYALSLPYDCVLTWVNNNRFWKPFT